MWHASCHMIKVNGLWLKKRRFFCLYQGFDLSCTYADQWGFFFSAAFCVSFLSTQKIHIYRCCLIYVFRIIGNAYHKMFTFSFFFFKYKKFVKNTFTYVWFQSIYIYIYIYIEGLVILESLFIIIRLKL